MGDYSEINGAFKDGRTAEQRQEFCVTGLRLRLRLTGSCQKRRPESRLVRRTQCDSSHPRTSIPISLLPLSKERLKALTFGSQTAADKSSSERSGVKKAATSCFGAASPESSGPADDSVENIFLCFFLRPDATSTKPPVLPPRRGDNDAVVPLIASGMNVNLLSQEASLWYFYSPEVFIYIRGIQ